MKLLSICLCIGILLFLMDFGLARKKYRISLMKRKYDGSDGESFIQSKKRKHSSKNNDDEEEEEVNEEDEDNIEQNDKDDGENKFIYACDKNDLDPICTCKNETLDCRKQLINRKLLSHTNFKIREHDFIVKTAYFNNNGITILKKGFIIPYNVEYVKSFEFSQNQISEIEDNAFDTFHELEILHMDSNLLTDIDDRVLTKKLGKTLQILYLDHNKIQTFSKAFIHLRNLKELHMGANPIIKFNKEMFPTSLANLQYLHIGAGGIKNLDDDIFLNLKSLKNLCLINNPLTTVPKALNGIPHLLILDLSATLIERLNSNAFNQDSNLSQIYFFDMPNFTSIDDCAFCGLPNLTSLSFWGCKKLTYIHENAFGALTNQKMPSIESLFLSGTNLTVLPEKLLNWELVKEINIPWNNHMACNCSMAWLINDLSLYRMFSSSIPKCASPPELINVSFTMVSGTICLDNEDLNSNSIFSPIILFATLSICFVAFLCYTRRIRKPFGYDLPTMSYRNLSAQQHHDDDEEELQAHF